MFAGHGVSKVRLTGGEPLLRRDVDRLVEMLAGIPAISGIALTPNGTALAAKAQVLKSAGLTRVTVSPDALDDKTFAAMNGASSEAPAPNFTGVASIVKIVSCGPWMAGLLASG